MNYSNYAKLLEAKRDNSLCGDFTPDEYDALAAAIELMRAADPRDPSAEREHCRVQVAETSMSGNVTADWLERERAAARAEGYARAKRENRELPPVDVYVAGPSPKEIHATIERAIGEITKIAHAATTKLAAAQAEITRLHAENEILDSTRGALRLSLETKLANLRDLLKTCHDRDYDGQGYGLTDKDREQIIELLGEEPSRIDAYGERKYR